MLVMMNSLVDTGQASLFSWTVMKDYDLISYLNTNKYAVEYVYSPRFKLQIIGIEAIFPVHVSKYDIDGGNFANYFLGSVVIYWVLVSTHTIPQDILTKNIKDLTQGIDQFIAFHTKYNHGNDQCLHRQIKNDGYPNLFYNATKVEPTSKKKHSQILQKLCQGSK